MTVDVFKLGCLHWRVYARIAYVKDDLTYADGANIKSTYFANTLFIGVVYISSTCIKIIYTKSA